MNTKLESLQVNAEKGETVRKRAVLSWSKAVKIRRLHKEGWSTREIARKFGVGHVAVHNIIAGKSWVKRE